MPQQVRRTHAGWDENGHHWENDGDVVTVSDSEASQLLAQPAVPLYSLVEPGATIEVEDGDPNEADGNSAAAQYERRLAAGSTPNDPRASAPNDNRPESPNTEGSGKSATFAAGKSDDLGVPASSAADASRTDAPKGKQADELDGPHRIDKTAGASGAKGDVVGRSDSK